MAETQQEQTIRQKKIALAQGIDMSTLLILLRECSKHEKLVGDTEFQTIVNAVTLDAQSQLIIDFINTIDRIKRGELLTTES